MRIGLGLMFAPGVFITGVPLNAQEPVADARPGKALLVSSTYVGGNRDEVITAVASDDSGHVHRR